MTIYSLDMLLSQYGTSPSFHDRFQLLFLDLHTDFSGDSRDHLVFPSVSEFSTVYCDLHSQRLDIINKAEVDDCLELCCFFKDQTDVGHLISGSSAFSKSSLNIWNFTVYILLKPGLENFEYYFTSV